MSGAVVTNSYLERIQQIVLPALGEGIPCFLAKGKITLGLARGEHWIKHGGVSRPAGLPDWVSVVGYATQARTPAEPGPAGSADDCFRFCNLLLQGHMPVGRPYQVPLRLLSPELGFPLTVPLGQGEAFVPNDQAVWQRLIQNLLDREVHVIGVLRAIPLTPKSGVFMPDIMLFEAYDMDGRLIWTNPIFGLEPAIQSYRSVSQAKIKHHGGQAAAKAQAAALESLTAKIEFPSLRPALSAQETLQVLRPVIANLEVLAEAVAAITKEPLEAIRRLVKPPHPRTREIKDMAATIPPGLPQAKKFKSLSDWTDLPVEVIQEILEEAEAPAEPAPAPSASVATPSVPPTDMPIVEVPQDPDKALEELTKAIAAAASTAPVQGLLAEIQPVTPHTAQSGQSQSPKSVPEISFDAPKTSLFDDDKKAGTIDLAELEAPLPGTRAAKPKPGPKPAASAAKPTSPKDPEPQKQEPAAKAPAEETPAKAKAPKPSPKPAAPARTEPRRVPPKIGVPLSGLDALETFLDMNYQEICESVVTFVRKQPHQVAKFHQIADYLKIGKRDELNRPIHDALNKRVLKVLVGSGKLMQSGAKKGSQYFLPIKKQG